MPEELLESSSSQGINPRLRSTRRVRAVPYECCGGLCSFLDSGCFSMCCGYPKVKRRSSTYDKKNRDKIPKNEEISEPSKKLIYPNVDDGITEEDKNVFLESDSHKLDENEKVPGGDLYISKEDIELESSSLNEKIDEEKYNSFSLNEEKASIVMDDISITESDVSGKKKKGKRNISNFLRMGRNKKSPDGVSITSSTASFEKSDKSEQIGTPDEKTLKGFMTDIDIESSPDKPQKELLILLDTSKIIAVNETSEHNNGEKSVTPEAKSTSEDTPDAASGTSGEKKKNGNRMMSIFQSLRRKSKGKKTNEDNSKRFDGVIQNVSKSAGVISVEEQEIIKSEKVIPLGISAPTNELKTVCTETEKNDECPEIDQNNVEKHKKKFPWITSIKKDKQKLGDDDQMQVEIDDTEGSYINSQKKIPVKKTFFEKVGSLKRFSKPPTALENEDAVDQAARDEKETSTVTNEETDENNIEAHKKTLLEAKKLLKSENPEKLLHKTKCTPSIFSACTNTNVRTDHERKLSSDSIEVKTIASYEGEPGDRDVTPIRIIRNDFFPDEVFDNSKKHIPSTPENNIEKTEDISSFEVESENDHLQNSHEDTGNLIEMQEETQEKEVKQESPIIEKKYGVIDTEDFSESLHTLIDEESPDYILLASSTVINDIYTSLKEDVCEEFQEEDEQRFEEKSFLRGTFRTSRSLSIEEPIKDIGDESSVETLVNSKNIEKPTDTLTEANKEPETREWIDITNIEDLDDSKFNYIYKTTLQNVQNSEDFAGKPDALQEDIDGTPSVQEVTSICNKTENCDKLKTAPGGLDDNEENCEKCGRIVEDNVRENSAIGQQKPICICTTLTRVRRSISQLEEGNVMTKVAILAESEQPIILPFKKDDIIISEAHSSPTLGSIKSGSKNATPSPTAAKSRSGTLSSTNSEWQNAEEDIDKLMVVQGRSSLSSLGLRSDSMASVYSGAGEGRYGTVAVRGQVEFGLQYNYKAGSLEIHVKQCKDLAAVDFKRNRSDPYVKVYLLPDKSKGGKRKTKVKKHTLNPVFDETLKFHISLNGLETRTLWLTVWHSDMFGRNDFLGEVMMALENKVFDDPTPKLYNLQERTEPFDDTISFKGDIIVCLKFVPPDMTVQKKGKRSRGTLQVLVKEAKYLTAYKANGASDPFCKSYLLPDKGRNSKQKTQVVKKTINPVWNHTFVYDDVTLQELAERCLELTVWDHDRIASNEFLGGVRFCLGTGKHYGKSVEWMDSTGKEMTLWKSMLERPNFWVEGCLSLRPTLDARTS